MCFGLSRVFRLFMKLLTQTRPEFREKRDLSKITSVFQFTNYTVLNEIVVGAKESEFTLRGLQPGTTHIVQIQPRSGELDIGPGFVFPVTTGNCISNSDGCTQVSTRLISDKKFRPGFLPCYKAC